MLVTLIFVAGFLLIIAEQQTGLNKSAVALVTSVLCWMAAGFNYDDGALMHELGEISGILFFLLGAMTIVELIDAHDGFSVITRMIRTRSKKRLMWIVGVCAFLLSALLDNLTTAIVMTSVMSKLLSEKKERWLFLGVVVIAANAGGAWSPIGDVTTTMLWIGGKVTSPVLIAKVLLPSIVCLCVPLVMLSLRLKGTFVPQPLSIINTRPSERNIVLISGLLILLMVPVFKSLTGLPPFMGMLLGLGILWIICEIVHRGREQADRVGFSVVTALQRIDTPSVLFFLGILLSVAALTETGALFQLATWLTVVAKNMNVVAIATGLISAVVDNVPLVAACMGMYSLDALPVDSSFWHFLAYAAGTGGSVLSIGSAAGVAVAGMEGITFGWWLKRISLAALSGFAAGAACYLIVN